MKTLSEFIKELKLHEKSCGDLPVNILTSNSFHLSLSTIYIDSESKMFLIFISAEQAKSNYQQSLAQIKRSREAASA